MDLGPNAIFIWASYAAAVLVLGALTGWLLLDGLRLSRQLEALEQRGIRRRAAGGSRSEPPGTRLGP
jgi:heme exporter protein D